ncbi:protein ALP1-like isoform X2 [Beta vulgaris subsp. vulgaris]|uniref:protein ALP1-like isoform X2 n=1 Tax=Beta vulgaris subsp. vulgaris TaxID=3555 RepID=UPI002549BF47|nr:protein ALP1-like isoform X2 [Beta vulgaris subsp. vulgaris]
MDIERRKKKRRKLFWIMTTCTTGEQWVTDVLSGHYIRCINAFRMESSVFKQLCEELQAKYGLRESKKMAVIEKVGIFVYTLALGISNRDVAERFQRSGETISRAFHEVLEAISGRTRAYMGLARDIIKPQDASFPGIPPQIEYDPRYMPYFKDAIGCIDGTHINACIPETEQLRYRGRKGNPTFNVMATCDFDMCFTFISLGWEGSAHDTRVFLHALNTQELNFPKPPEGKYYLVDKGYPDRKGYLVPYPKTRYHKDEFTNMPPTNEREAFNRSHSSLRSCIERSFGVLKKRWKILGQMPQFSVETQLDVIMAAFALHNYIRKNSTEDLIFRMVDENPDYMPCEELPDVIHARNNETSRETSKEMEKVRDDIALL